MTGTSEGVKKAWDKRGRGRKEIAKDISNDKTSSKKFLGMSDVEKQRGERLDLPSHTKEAWLNSLGMMKLPSDESGYYYHATTSDRLDSISEHGLVPGMSKPNFPSEINRHSNETFLSKRLNDVPGEPYGAEYWSRMIHRTNKNRPIILRVKETALSDVKQVGNEYEHRTPTKIDSSNLEILKFGRWIPLSELKTNVGTSEGVKKGWQKRKRAKPEITSDIKSGKTIIKSEYKQIKSELLASPLPSVENRNAKAQTEPGHVNGLPPEVELKDNIDRFYQYHEAIRRGGFEFDGKQIDSGYNGYTKTYNVIVKPANLPKEWKQFKSFKTDEKATWYNPDYYEVYNESENWTRLRPKDPTVLEEPKGEEDGYVFRGMCYEEFENIMKNGYIESNGGYNFNFQHGQTYFSVKKDQAAFYANGFAPWQYKALPNRPAIMIKIKDPGNRVPGTIGDEVAYEGKVSADLIEEVYVGTPVRIDEGEFEVRTSQFTGGEAETGSSVGLGSSVVWKKHPYKNGMKVNVGTSEGIRKGWLKRKRARPELMSDIRNGNSISKDEYHYIKKMLTAPMPIEEKYRTMKDVKSSKTIFNDKLTPEEKEIYGLESDIKNYLWKNSKELDYVLGAESMGMMERVARNSREIDKERKHKISKVSGDFGFYHDSPDDEKLHLISSLVENPKWLAEKDPLIYNRIVRAAASGALGSKAKTAIKLKPIEIKDDKPSWKKEYVNDEWKNYQKASFADFAKSESGKETFSDELQGDKVEPISDKYDSGIEIPSEFKSLKTTSDFYNTMIDKFGVEDYTDQHMPIENKIMMVAVLDKVNKVLPNFPLPHVKIGDTGSLSFSVGAPLAVTDTHSSGVVVSQLHFGVGKNVNAQQILCKSIDMKTHAPGTANFESVFMHELGHVLHLEISKSDSEEAMDAHSELVNTFDHENAISRYALANDDEFFAEHFASAMLPNKYVKDNPNIINMTKFINRLSKKAGGKQI